MKRIIKVISPIILILLFNVLIVNADNTIDLFNNTTEIHVSIDGVEQAYPVAPMIVNDRTFVPLRSVFESLGTKVEWVEEIKTAKAVKDDITIEVTLDSYFAKKNGEVIKLDAKPFIQEGRTMIPLRFVSEAFGAQVYWDELENKVVIITSKEEKNAEDENKNTETTNIITYEEATQKAFDYSYELKNQLAEIERLEELRSDAGDALGYSSPTGQGNGQDDADYFNKLKNVKSLDVNLQMSERKLEDMKESIRFEVKNTMNEINKLLDEKELMNLEIEDAKIKLEFARAKEEKGLLSKYDLEKEEDAYQKITKEKEVLQKSIETAYTKLNNLIGMNQNEKYNLEYHITYEPLDEDIDYVVAKVMNENPSIWNQEKKIELAELDLKLYVFNAGGDSYEVKEIDLLQEKYELANLKQGLEESIRTMYNQIQQLEKNYELLEINLKSEERTLDLVRAQYNVGMATEIQLEQASLAVAQIKNDIKSKALEHEKLKVLLYKPYITGN